MRLADATLLGFQHTLQKSALSAALMARWAKARAAQGVGGAAAAGKQIAKAQAAGATTSRQIMARSGGLLKHRATGIAQGAAAQRQTAKRLGGGIQSTRANLQQRIAKADALPQRFDTSRTLRTADTVGAHPYSKQYLGTMVEGRTGVAYGARAGAGNVRPVARSPMASAAATNARAGALGVPAGGGTAVGGLRARRLAARKRLAYGNTAAARTPVPRAGSNVGGRRPITGYERTTVGPALRRAA